MKSFFLPKLNIFLICFFFIIPCEIVSRDKVKEKALTFIGELDLIKAIDAFAQENDLKDRKLNRFLQMVEKLPPKASLKELNSNIGSLLDEMGRITRGDINLLRKGVVLLARQPKIIKSLVKYYDSLEKRSYYKRLRVLQLVGELQLNESLNFLKGIVWEPLPESMKVYSPHISQGDFESMLKSKAIQGIAFIRTTDGKYKKKADEEVLRVMMDHPSRIIRISAINSYMWNHGDSGAAAKFLYRKLEKRFHKYVERPRFYKGANSELFEKRLKSWREKWISNK